jgi:hypothetical protein
MSRLRAEGGFCHDGTWRRRAIMYERACSSSAISFCRSWGWCCHVDGAHSEKMLYGTQALETFEAPCGPSTELGHSPAALPRSRMGIGCDGRSVSQACATICHAPAFLMRSNISTERCTSASFSVISQAANATATLPSTRIWFPSTAPANEHSLVPFRGFIHSMNASTEWRLAGRAAG